MRHPVDNPWPNVLTINIYLQDVYAFIYVLVNKWVFPCLTNPNRA